MAKTLTGVRFSLISRDKEQNDRSYISMITYEQNENKEKVVGADGRGEQNSFLPAFHDV